MRTLNNILCKSFIHYVNNYLRDKQKECLLSRTAPRLTTTLSMTPRSERWKGLFQFRATFRGFFPIGVFENGKTRSDRAACKLVWKCRGGCGWGGAKKNNKIIRLISAQTNDRHFIYTACPNRKHSLHSETDTRSIVAVSSSFVIITI